jgi:hypothetical protein
MVLILTLLAASGPGCGRDGRMDRLVTPDNGTGNATLDVAEPALREWPYWPRRMRIHPLTQFATNRDTGQLIIEARIEFFDEHGHTCKGVGQVLLDLHATGSATTTTS